VSTEAVDGQLRVYDEELEIGYLLNETAAVVWRSCDGA
jgi:hypothetical protein